MSAVESFLRESRLASRRLLARPAGALATVFLIVLGAAPLIAVIALYAQLTTGALPFRDADRLVHLTARAEKLSWDTGLSRPLIADLRTQTPSLVALGGFEIKAAAYGGREGRQSDEITLMRVQPGLLDVFGLQSLDLPRDAADRFSTIGPPALLLTAQFARRSFGDPAAIVGDSLLVDGASVRVAGILPDDFRFPGQAVDAWLLAPETAEQVQPAQAGNFSGMSLVGRLAPGATLATLQQEMARSVRRDPAVAKMVDEIGLQVSAYPLRHYWVRSESLRAVLAVAVALFAVALVNALGLSMLRAWSQRHELALIQTLGANRLDINLRAVAEAGILVGAAVALSLALVPRVARLLLLQGMAPADLPIPLTAGLTVVATSLLVGAIALVCLTLGAALVRALANLDSLAAGTRRQTETRRGKWISASFATAQMTLGACVLYLALLTSQSAGSLVNQNLGFPRDDLWVVGIDSYARATDDAQIATRRAALDGWLRQVSALPGSARAAYASVAPLADSVFLAPYKVPSASAQDAPPVANIYHVGADYFDALGLPLLTGRVFNRGETSTEHPVAVIDERIARRHFGSESPLGRTLLVTTTDERTQKVSIVGIVADSRQRSLAQPDQYPSIYLPREVPYRMAGLPTESFEMLIRTDSSGQVSRKSLAEALAGFDGSLRISKVERMSQRIERQITSLISLRNVLVLLSAVVLFLTCAGLYATISARVDSQRREFGIRKSLGATAGRIFARVLCLAMLMVAAALVIAFPLTLFGGTHLVEASGQQLTASRSTYCLVAAIMLSAVFIAVLVPALRASTTPPSRSLRDE
jgi:predicted permease